MDVKSEIKIKKIKGGKKDKKDKKKSKKPRKSTRKPLQTLQTLQPLKPQEKKDLGPSQPFGAGGLGGFLSALGIQPKFQQMGGTSGFNYVPTQSLTKTYKQAPIEPKLKDETITYIPPEESAKKEAEIFKKLEKGLGKMSKEDLRNHIFQYFGGPSSVDLDYVVQDAILEYKTKKGMLGAIARYAEMGYGNIDINKLINFKPTITVETGENVELESIGPAPASASAPAPVGGEDINELSSLGFEEEE